jgi:hypothetical protein
MTARHHHMIATPRRKCVLLMSTLALVTAPVTRAQPPACHGTPPSADSLPATLKVELTTPDGDSIPAGDAKPLFAVVREAVRIPLPLPIPAWMSSVGHTIPYVDGIATFTIARDGHVTNIHLDVSTLVPALDSAVLSALRGAPPLPAGRKIKAAMRVDVVTPLPPLIASVVILPASGETHHRLSPPASMVLDSTRVPVWPPMPLPKLVSITPVPTFLRVSGAVDLLVVLDQHGHILSGSERALQPSDRSSVDLARTFTPAYRFAVSTLGGCPVNAAIVMPIRFPDN